MHGLAEHLLSEASKITAEAQIEIIHQKATIEAFNGHFEWIKEVFGNCVNTDYSEMTLAEHIDFFYKENITTEKPPQNEHRRKD